MIQTRVFHYLFSALCVVCLATPAFGVADGGGSGHVGNGAPKTPKKTVVREKVDGKDFQVEVTIVPDAKTVTVASLGGKATPLPSNMELRMKTKTGDGPLVSLQADAPQSPTRFTGKLEQWNDSFTGFELRFSADKKQWSKVNRSFGL